MAKTPSSQPLTPRQKEASFTHFMSLPREIRLIIYEKTFENETLVVSMKRQGHAGSSYRRIELKPYRRSPWQKAFSVQEICYTSKQVYHESISILRRQARALHLNEYAFADSDSVLWLPESLIRSIERLSITLAEEEFLDWDQPSNHGVRRRNQAKNQAKLNAINSFPNLQYLRVYFEQWLNPGVEDSGYDYPWSPWALRKLINLKKAYDFEIRIRFYAEISKGQQITQMIATYTPHHGIRFDYEMDVARNVAHEVEVEEALGLDDIDEDFMEELLIIPTGSTISKEEALRAIPERIAPERAGAFEAACEEFFVNGIFTSTYRHEQWTVCHSVVLRTM